MSNDTEAVILLHGLARRSHSMKKLARALSNSGYNVVNVDYPSTHHNIADLSEKVIPSAIAKAPYAEKIHFITHSLGGILLRYYLRQHSFKHLGRVVMLAPPNQGSELADWLTRYSLFRICLGPSAGQLGTIADMASIPATLGPVTFELGIIAGTKAFNLLMRHHLPTPNDGTVAVDSTKVEGMSDHICVPVSHPFIMQNAQVIRQSLYFLKHGHFQR